MIGYTTGVFDIFHIGHLNLLERAKKECSHLIVAVCTDELTKQLKGKKPLFPFEERIKIVQAIKYADSVVPETLDDKLAAWEKYKFDLIFKGDDWKGTPKWKALEEEFSRRGVKVVYFPYTRETSSTIIKTRLDKKSKK